MEGVDALPAKMEEVTLEEVTLEEVKVGEVKVEDTEVKVEGVKVEEVKEEVKVDGVKVEDKEVKVEVKADGKVEKLEEAKVEVKVEAVKVDEVDEEVEVAEDGVVSGEVDGVEVFEAESRGRGLRTTRDLCTGDVLFAAPPYAAVVFDSLLDSVCHCCLKRGPQLHRCAACRFAFYCDRSCQRVAWTGGHSAECAALRRHGAAPPENVRLAARILWRWQKAGGARCQGDLVSVLNLQGQVSGLSEEEAEALSGDAAALRQYWAPEGSSGAAHKVGTQTFTHVLSLIGCNSFSLSDEGGMASVGVGLFVNLCLLNHDCWPNCTAVFNTGSCTVAMGTVNPAQRMELRALEKVRAGEELTVSYVDFLNPSWVRRDALRHRYRFLCCCRHCSLGIKDDLMAGVKLVDGQKPSEEKLKAVEQMTKETLDKVEQLKSRNLWVEVLKLCRECLGRQQELLLDTHVMVVRMVRLMADVTAYLQAFDEAAQLCQRTVDAYEKIYHPNNAQLGMMVMRAGVTHWHAGLIEAAHSLVCRALGILMVTHGPLHRITKDLEGLRAQTEMELRLFRENEFMYHKLREAALDGASMKVMSEPQLPGSDTGTVR